MKAIVIKINDKPLFVSQICDLSTKQFLDLKGECEKVHQTYEEQHELDLTRIRTLESRCDALNERIENLQHQINIITGVEESEEEE